MDLPPDLEQILGLAQLLAAGLLAVFLLVAGQTLWTLVRPPRMGIAAAIARGRATNPSELSPSRRYDSWTFEGGPGGRWTLPVWDIPGDDPDGPVVILTHGWGESRIPGLARVEAIAPCCSRIVSWDLPGHGEAEGSTSLGWREPEDLVALARRVAEEGGGRPIVLFGSSMGAGVSIVAGRRLAEEGLVAGVIAEAPYRQAIRPARNVIRLKGLPSGPTLSFAMACVGLSCGAGARWRRFDRLPHAAGLPCPLLVLCGTADVVCPPDDAHALAEAAPHGRLVMIEGAGHVALWHEEPHRSRCAEEAAAFLARAGSRSPTVAA